MCICCRAKICNRVHQDSNSLSDNWQGTLMIFLLIYSSGLKLWESESERDRQMWEKKERQTDRHGGRKNDRDGERQTNRHVVEKDTDRCGKMQTNRRWGWGRKRQTWKEIETNRHEGERDRRRGRETNRCGGGETDVEGERDIDRQAWGGEREKNKRGVENEG